MTTQIDWQGELERAIEPIPDRPSIEYVTAGHRAARRRSTIVAVAGLASALVLGGLAWVVVPGDGPARTESTVATSGPSPSATEAPSETMAPDPAGLSFDVAGLADWSTDGIEPHDGVTLVRQVDDPHDVEPPGTSLGLVLEHDGGTTWVSLIGDPGGFSSSSTDAARSGWLTFDQWLAEQVAQEAGEPGLRLVAMDADGDLRALEPGVEIVDARDTLAEPAVASYVGRSAKASAVAELTWQGGTWFVLVVRSHGRDNITTVAAAKADDATSIDEFLDVMRRSVAEGGFR